MNTVSNNSELKQILISLVGNTPFGIITIDFKGKIILINQQATSILGLNERISKYLDINITKLFNCESIFYKKIEKCITQGRFNFNIEQEEFNDKILSIKARLFINGMLITLEDITDAVFAQKQLKDRTKQLEIKNKELEQFAYISSHDLQEPLNTISSFTDFIIDDESVNIPVETKKYLDIIKQASNRMSSQIKGLLEYSRIGKDKQKTHIDCNQIVDEVLMGLSNKILKYKATINKSILPSISVYKEEFQSLIQNLISNAIKYSKTNHPPKIEIKSEENDQFHLFSIKDNGIGIDEKHFQRIFIIFQRLHNKDEYSGNGIGLAFCKKIVELHGGQLWLRSKLNEGTTFYFTINKI